MHPRLASRAVHAAQLGLAWVAIELPGSGNRPRSAALVLPLVELQLADLLLRIADRAAGQAAQE